MSPSNVVLLHAPASMDDARGFNAWIDIWSVKKVTNTLALFIAGGCGVEET